MIKCLVIIEEQASTTGVYQTRRIIYGKDTREILSILADVVDEEYEKRDVGYKRFPVTIKLEYIPDKEL